MITKEILKGKIDNLNKIHFDELYKIIQAFETADMLSNKKKFWNQFINNTYGCLSETPIIREPQGSYDIRKDFK